MRSLFPCALQRRLQIRLLFIFLIVLFSVKGQESSSAGSDCPLSSNVRQRYLDGDSRTWTLTDAFFENYDLQAVVNCTQWNDTIALNTTEVVQPANRIILPRSLTITGVDADGNPSKVRMTCPINQGLILMGETGLTLQSLIIRDCALADENINGVVETVTCGPSSSLPHQVSLVDVDFVGNLHSNGSAALAVEDPDCYEVTMENVQFRRNQFGRRQQMAQSNLLTNISAVNNRLDSSKTVLFAFPSNVVVTITGFDVEDNEGGGIISVDPLDFESRVESSTIQNASLTVRNAQFVNNTNLEGSLMRLQSPGEAEISSSSFDGSTGRSGSVLFSENKVENSVLRLTLSETIFSGNIARMGMSSGDSAKGIVFVRGPGMQLSVDACRFDGNSADQGGGIYIVNLRTSESSIRNSIFSNNRASAEGGAVVVTLTDQLLLTSVSFLNNSASSAGALHVGPEVRATIRDAQFLDNEAEMEGGAIASDRGVWVMDIFSTRFQGNEAQSGGAMHLLPINRRFRMRRCRLEGNRVRVMGGALSLTHAPDALTDALYDIRNSEFHENSAFIGGAVFVAVDQVDAEMQSSRPNTKQSSRVFIDWIRSSNFVRNKAEVAGGAIFAEKLSGFRGCIINERQGSSERNISQFQDFRRCQNFRNNIVRDGYGPQAASTTNAFNAVFTYDNNNKNTSISSGTIHAIPRWRSGDTFPIIWMQTVDYFGQGPSFTKTEISRSFDPDAEDPYGRVRGLASSDNGFIPNAMVTTLSNGTGSITLGRPLSLPGNYRLDVYLEDVSASNITVEIEVRRCRINEEKTQDGKLCATCDDFNFNFDPDTSNCTLCDEDVICGGWGVAPNRDIWIPSPCFSEAHECLSPIACHYDGRREAFADFFRIMTPATCDLNQTALDLFNNAQCNEGHEGILCGSCSGGYGQFDFGCIECQHYFFVVLWMIASIFWLGVVSAFAAVGNLSDASQSEMSIVPTKMMIRPTISLASRREQPEDDSEGEATHSMPTVAQCDAAKRNITESIKLFLNFAQVNSIAVNINAGWTASVERVLQILNFVGSVSGETTISLDCLFSKDTSIPRSIIRLAIELLSPFLVLAVGTLYWKFTEHQSDVFRRRFVLTAVVVFYIAYIGWAEQLSSVLDCKRLPEGITPDDVIYRRLWTQDTSVTCFEGSHAILLFVLVIPMILIILLAFPIASAIYLLHARRSDQLKTVKVKEKFGFMYVAYTEKCVYWDCLILLRKAALAIVIVFGALLGGNMQGLIALSILVVSLYMQTTYRPYDDAYATLNQLETGSMLVSSFTFIAGLFLNDDRITQGGRTAVSVLTITMIVSYVVYSVWDLYCKVIVYLRISLEREHVEIGESEMGVKIASRWIYHRVIGAKQKLHRMIRKQDPA